MSIEDQRGTERGALKWPRPALARRQAESTPLYTYVLDADTDLAEEFDLRSRVAARQLATARVLHAPVGDCDLAPWFDAVGQGPGLLILDGVVAFQTRVGDRTALELVGSGDLLQLPSQRADDLLERGDGWRVLVATRFALLDAAFADRVRPWPQIVQELLRRAGRRTADVDALRAITCQPRLEVRLVLLLWHLAARWGRVEPAGIRVTLPLTHRLLGQLVAAERPSVSHALARLGHAGLVTGTAGDLHLKGTLEEHLEALLERTTSLRANGRSASNRIA
jgi:CRP/FNR family transcriptional regulator, cyclic AMP receptor protein